MLGGRIGASGLIGIALIVVRIEGIIALDPACAYPRFKSMRALPIDRHHNQCHISPAWRRPRAGASVTEPMAKAEVADQADVLDGTTCWTGRRAGRDDVLD